jgi:hypothetical protein
MMLRKYRLRLFILTLILFLSPYSFAAERLHSWVANDVKKVTQKLDKAESFAQKGDLPNARTYLEAAQSIWQQIHATMRDKFSDDHPEIVATSNRLAAVEQSITSASGAQQEVKQKTSTIQNTVPATSKTVTQEPVKTAGSVNTGPAITDPLPSTMVYDMKGLDKQADNIINSAATMSSAKAKKMLEGKGTPWDVWNTKKAWDKGKFNPQHPDVVALEAKMVKAKKLLQARIEQGADAQSKLAQVLPVIMKNSALLKATHEKAKWEVQAVGSAVSDGDPDKLIKALDKVRLPVERVNTLLPGARNAVKNFRAQFPDMNELNKLTDFGSYQPGKMSPKNALIYVDRFADEWLHNLQFQVKEALREAESNIKMYGLNKLAVLKGKDTGLQQRAADSAEEQVVIFSSLLLDTVDALLPELTQEEKDVLPEFVQARQEALQKVSPMRKDIAKVNTAVRKIRKDVTDAERHKLSAARFPKSDYKGGKWAEAEKVIRVAFTAKIKDKKLLKISIYRPWEVRDEARWRNDHWQINTYRYIGANCLAKLKNGKYMVYRMNFRNTKLADGSWSPLEQWSVGHVYEILMENIDK